MTEKCELENARQLFGQGNRNEARNILIKAVRNDPRNPGYLVWAVILRG